MGIFSFFKSHKEKGSEKIEEWKGAAENWDAEAIFDGKSLDGWSAVPELNDRKFEALIDIFWQVNQKSKL